MGKVNKLASIISIASILTIATSLTYYHNKLNAQEENILVERKQDFEIITTNVEIVASESSEGILDVSLKNISNRDLTDVVVELIHSGKKISEVYISDFSKGSEKKIELVLSQLENLKEVAENNTLFNEYRLKEEKKFEDYSIEVVVSSYKSQTRDTYKNLVSTNTILDDESKKKILEKIDTANSIEEVEKLFKENNVYPEIKFSENYLIFDAEQDSIQINTTNEENTVEIESVTTSPTSVDEIIGNENTSSDTIRVLQPASEGRIVAPIIRTETTIANTANTKDSVVDSISPRSEERPIETTVQATGNNPSMETPTEVEVTIKESN